MSRGDTKVFLGNLPPECRVRDIEGFFESHGRVRNVLIKQGKYGFAEFEDSREAEDAVCDLHGKKLLGSRVTVEFAKVGHSSLKIQQTTQIKLIETCHLSLFRTFHLLLGSKER